MSLHPELELVQEHEHSLRYLSHGADSPLIRWHYHREYELHLIRRTRGKAFVGDYIGMFRPGTVFLCGPNLPHNWITTHDESPGIRDEVVNFSDELMQALATTMPEFRAFRPMLDDARYGLEFSEATTRPLIPLFERIGESRGTNQVLNFLSLMNALVKAGDYRILSTRSYEENTDPMMEDRVNTVVEYLARNYQREITLEEVAGLLHLSPNFFSRYFKKATGRRFIDFVIRLRISKACERLELTNDPITNICYEVGYANVANFNRQFLKIKGMTPRQYRESLSLRNARTTPDTDPS
ncbi:helix-turn-helix domain-containing protein [Saccharospirillum salsuginis]|uniref:AraC family transcriptional regulator n=1 Tax=Saccharospirillum salsuginis TaxID=418750 RepID=A0A918KMK4_9GAMM|nr:AraC family transcriptional regulator [Saccharospirillum salsuginis]GGX67471.1 AraC family transcriptional regulator [Saccharospirillum salsuginis]